MSNNNKYGCSQCATFLNKESVAMYPLKPQHLLSGGRNQILQLEYREKLIAYNIANTLY